MKKNKLPLLLILFALSISACYNPNDSDDKKTSKSPQKSSPVAENKATPSEIKTTGNFSQAKNDYDAKQYEKAAAGFEEIIKSDASNFEAHFYLGKTRQALKEDDKAIAAFKEAVKIKPEHADANFELGNIYFGRKEYETAQPYYQQAVKTNFKDPVMLMALGDNYSALKKNDFAIVQYQKVVEFDKTNSDAMYKSGLAYISMGNKIAARQQAQRLEPVDAQKAKKLLELIDKM